MTTIEEVQKWRGRQVSGILEFDDDEHPGERKTWAVRGRLDAIGPMGDKTMLAIGDDKGDGVVYMLPNSPRTKIELEVLP